MSKKKDITGIRFGNLVAIRQSNYMKNGMSYWLCRCDCGRLKDVRLSNLTCGKTLSCGFDRMNHTLPEHKKQNHDRLRSIWDGMVQRCTNVRSKDYEKYGGSGIGICEEWMNYTTFKAWALENGYADNLSIDRVDGGLGYCPSNCRWATRETQNRNRRTSFVVNYMGKDMSLSEACELSGLGYSVVHRRIKYLNWTVEKALNTPIKNRKGDKKWQQEQ